MPDGNSGGFSRVDLTALDFRITKKWLETVSRKPWLSFLPEYAMDPEGELFMRRGVGFPTYRAVSITDGKIKYACNSCGGPVMAATVVHLVRDGPFSFPGSERREFENIPYCPNCEEKPGTPGAPV